MSFITHRVYDYGYIELASSDISPPVTSRRNGYRINHIPLTHYNGLSGSDFHKDTRIVGMARYDLGEGLSNIPSGYKSALLHVVIQPVANNMDTVRQKLFIAGVKEEYDLLFRNGWSFVRGFKERQTSAIAEVDYRFHLPPGNTSTYVIPVNVKPVIDELIASEEMQSWTDKNRWLTFAYYLMPAQHPVGPYVPRQYIKYQTGQVENDTLVFEVGRRFSLSVSGSESQSVSYGPNNIVGLGDEISWHTPESQMDALINTTMQPNHVSEGLHKIAVLGRSGDPDDVYDIEEGTLSFDPPWRLRHLTAASFDGSRNRPLEGAKEMTVSFWMKYRAVRGVSTRILGNIGGRTQGMWVGAYTETGEDLRIYWFFADNTERSPLRWDIDLPDDEDLYQSYYHVCLRTKFFDPPQYTFGTNSDDPYDLYTMIQVTRADGKVVFEVSENTWAQNFLEIANIGDSTNRLPNSSFASGLGLKNGASNYIGAINGYDSTGTLPRATFYGFLKDIRLFDHAITAREVQHLAKSPSVAGGIIPMDVQSAQSSSECSSPNASLANAPAKSLESASNVKSFSLARDSQVILSGSESASEAETLLLSVRVVVDSAESASQCLPLDVSRDSELLIDSNQAMPHCQSFALGISGAANVDDVVSLSNASAVNVDPDIVRGGLGETLWYCPSLDDNNVGGPALEDFSVGRNRASLHGIAGLPFDEANMWGDHKGNGGSRSIRVGSRSNCTIPSSVFSSSTTSASLSIHFKDNSSSSQPGGSAFIYNNDSVFIEISTRKRTNQIIVSTDKLSLSGQVSSINDMNHIVITYEDNGEMSLYLNGDLAVTQPHVGENSDRNGDRYRRLPGAGYLTYGEFDDLRLYNNRVLTQHEVTWLYNGLNRGGRGVLGPAPLEAVGSQSSSEVSPPNVIPDLRSDSVVSNSQVSEPALRANALLSLDSAESASHCSETDLIVRNFDEDRDPLIIGDRMSQSLERAVLEFSIQSVATRLPVYLHLKVTNVNQDFIATAGRWTSEFPTTYVELQEGTISANDRVDFTPEVGDVILDITSMVATERRSGSETIIVCLLEEENFSNRYYQVDNSSYKPYLSFDVVTGLSVDSVQSSSQCEAPFIDINLAVNSSQSQAEVSSPAMGVNSSSMLLDSAESQANLNLIYQMGMHTSLVVDSAQSAAQCDTVFIQTDYITYGYHKEFRGFLPDPADDMVPFNGGSNWYYYKIDIAGSGVRNNGEGSDLYVKVKIPRYGHLNTAWNFMGASEISPNAEYEVDVFIYDLGDTNHVRTLTRLNSKDFIYEIPPGTYELVFSPRVLTGDSNQLKNIYLEHVELQAIPAVLADPRDVQSSSRCSNVILGTNGLDVGTPSIESTSMAENVSIGVPTTTDSVQSQSQCSEIGLLTEVGMSVSDIESISEVEEVSLSGHSNLVLDSAQSSSEAQGFRLPTDRGVDPNSAQSNTEVSSPVLQPNFGVDASDIEVATEVSSPAVSGHSVLSVDSAQSAAENLPLLLTSNKSLEVDSAQSLSQNSQASVSQSIFFDEDSVGVCTPEGNDESIFTTEAGERINKGDLVTVYSDGFAYLSDSEEQWRSVYSGFALTSANVGEIVVIVEAGDLKVGDGKLSPNQLYIVATRRGRIRHADQLSSGDYMSIVGIAISSGVIRIGTNFVSTALSAVSDNFATDNVLNIDGDALRMDDNVITPTVVSGIVSEPIVVGDAVTRPLAKAAATSLELSAFGGIAISDALDGCTVAVCRIGDIYCGPGVLVKNRVYALSRTTGKLMLASDLQAGDYATLVGLAITSSTLRVSDIAKGTLAL